MKTIGAEITKATKQNLQISEFDKKMRMRNVMRAMQLKLLCQEPNRVFNLSPNLNDE